MKKILSTAVMLLLAVSLVACGQPASADMIKSDHNRITSPQVAEADLEALLQGNSDFALSLYQVLKDNQDGNFLYSPYSISLMMAMAYAGANGQTQAEMADALRFNLSPDELHAAFNYLALELAKRTTGEENFNLKVVNDIWGQRDYKFLDAYLDTLAENYDAGLRVLDFENDPEGSRQVINDYIYEQTNKLIKDLIPEGSINTLTRMVLTNAVYFKADWATKFNKLSTGPATFTLLDGTQVDVSMMHGKTVYSYASGNGWKAIELPYVGEQVAMDIILPEDFSSFEQTLDIDTLNAILAEMNPETIQLSLPKFKFASDFDLSQALKDMGMSMAFDPGLADFSGITDADSLYIQGIVHKAVVAVDEEGTEAAAAGAVVMGTTSMTESMVVDSPFVFLIRDLGTGSILFMGRVMNPNAA
jgi:serpin B